MDRRGKHCKIDIKGQRFSRLLALEELERRSKSGEIYWKCICDCGNIVEVCGTYLRNGKVQSCGCLCSEKTRKMATTHGLSKSRLFHVWRTMKARCYRESATGYSNYGGRGIKVCDEWKDDFVAFYNWAIANGYREAEHRECTLDRIDNDGDYCPENCKWSSMIEQSNNKRTNTRLEAYGENHTIAEWARITGLNPSVMYQRVHDQGLEGEAVLQPLQRKRRSKT